MRKFGLVFLLGFSMVLVFAYAAAPLWRGRTLSSNEVKEKWGEKVFVSSQFKEGTAVQKSAMAFKILTDKSLIGLDLEEIRTRFGKPDGFYFIDSYPAYIIQEGKTRKEETWQIVFLLNGKYKVRDIIVHKNCCD